MRAHLAERHDDVARLERAGGGLRKHRRVQHEVVGVDDGRPASSAAGRRRRRRSRRPPPGHLRRACLVSRRTTAPAASRGRPRRRFRFDKAYVCHYEYPFKAHGTRRQGGGSTCAASPCIAVLLASSAVVATARAPARAARNLTLVAYSTPREAYSEDHPGVPEDACRQGRRLQQSYGASGDQARAVAAGLKADVVALSLGRTSTSSSRQARRPGWKASVRRDRHHSVVVFVVRARQPEEDQGLERPDQAGRPGRHAEPFTSGGAKWNIMAAYGAQPQVAGPTSRRWLPAEAVRPRRLAGQERARRPADVPRRQGRVLLAYENEAIFAQRKGQNLPFVIPRATILIENPIAVAEDVRRQGGRERSCSSCSRRRPSGLRRERLPAGAEGGRASSRRSSRPGPASSRSTRSARRLGQGPEAVVRPEEAGSWRGSSGRTGDANG